MDPKDICRYLKSGEAIAIVWQVEDVKSVRPDLNEEQCKQVLQECDRRHDATIGINWEVIEIHADLLFPEP